MKERVSFRAMNRPLYSIRMRSTRDGHHHSGSERLANVAELEQLAGSMVQRALKHSRGRAESIQLSIEQVAEEQVLRVGLPDLRTWLVDDYGQGRQAAGWLLREAGVSARAVDSAIKAMTAGASPEGRSMRGAMLIDADNGERLEPDRGRGVRVSRMDLSSQAREALNRQLQALGLDNDHVREALVLAGKVLTAPGIVAELCWSDDPDYTAGYVASIRQGYVRFPHLKPLGEERGGRAFFVSADAIDLASLIYYLETRPVLFERIGHLHQPQPWMAQR